MDLIGINPAGEIYNPFRPVIQYLRGTNIYEYANSHPLMNTDPSGLEWISLNYWYNVPSTKTVEGPCMKYNKYLVWEEKTSEGARLDSKFIWDYRVWHLFKCKIEFNDWKFDKFRFKREILKIKRNVAFLSFGSAVVNTG